MRESQDNCKCEELALIIKSLIELNRSWIANNYDRDVNNALEKQVKGLIDN